MQAEAEEKARCERRIEELKENGDYEDAKAKRNGQKLPSARPDRCAGLRQLGRCTRVCLPSLHLLIHCLRLLRLPRMCYSSWAAAGSARPAAAPPAALPALPAGASAAAP